MNNTGFNINSTNNGNINNHYVKIKIYNICNNNMENQLIIASKNINHKLNLYPSKMPKLLPNYNDNQKIFKNFNMLLWDNHNNKNKVVNLFMDYGGKIVTKTSNNFDCIFVINKKHAIKNDYYNQCIQ